MRFLGVAWATLGIGLIVAAVIAWFIDREGAQPRHLYKWDKPIVLVVLGERVDPTGYAGETLQVRLMDALDGRGGEVMLVSGGAGRSGRSQAAVGCDFAVNGGVPADECLIEDQSHSMVEHAKFTLQLLRKTYPSGFHVLLISDPYELPRARRVFERLSGDEVGTHPVLDAPRYVKPLQRVFWTMREVPAMLRDLILTS